MSLRGPRGGRIRGRGTARGRGRGRGKTVKWEWQNNYTPGPEVYNELWHIRQAPATVTPFLPTECPIPDAQSRITDRRQTEGEIQRNFYVVEVTRCGARTSSVSSAEGSQADSTEIYHVDLSRILEYVSPDELERYENEQFRLEAEAEAVAKRIEAEEEAREQLERNAHVNTTGPGSRMLSELSTGPSSQSRGRGRGRGRARGRGRWPGRGAFAANSASGMEDDAQEQLVDVESEEALHRGEEGLELAIPETESEEEDLTADEVVRSSPTIARSAFVANSALPLSPMLSHRRAPAMFSSQQQINDESSEVESDLELVHADARLMSSAAMQLRDEYDGRGREDSTAHTSEGRRRSTISVGSSQLVASTKPAVPISQRSDGVTSRTHSVPETPHDSAADSSDDDIPAHPPTYSNRTVQNSDVKSMGLDSDHGSTVAETIDVQPIGGVGDSEDAEEYVVEAILEHYREAGKKYYLVKWQGYEDSHDWLQEEDLEGAAELVAEYDARMRKKKGKQKMID